MHSAQHIYATAPLGSLIRFGTAQPRPPERFKRKVREWESQNGVGRLVKRRPARGSIPATITLHLGDFESGGVIIMVAHRVFEVGGTERFEIAEPPMAGTVRILTRDPGGDELRHLAPDMTAAQQWIAANRMSNMRAEVVPYPDPVVVPEALGLAA